MILDEYINLITSEHISRPKYLAMISAGLLPIVKLQEILSALPLSFDVDYAIGKQLDVVGEWVGRSRIVEIPLTGVYFSFDDTIITGWDSGVWKSQFDPDSGLPSLPDDQYRTLIKAKIAANNWDGTIPGAYSVWQKAFGVTSKIAIQDAQDMSFIIALFGLTLDAVTFALLTKNYIPLKPEGVKITNYSAAPDSGPIFAFDVNNDLLKGWDQSSWPNEIIPT
jgi:Protein of unknown function (DUF2612)